MQQRPTLLKASSCLLEYFTLSLPLYLVVLLAITLSEAQANQPRKIFVFGDSLSDNGNLNIFRPTSDGLKTTEFLAQKFGLNLRPSRHYLGFSMGTNYALSAATARGVTRLDLSHQVEVFLKHHNDTAPKDALYIMFIGTNDVRDATENLTHGLEVISKAIRIIKLQALKLIDHGARQIILINSPDLTITPALHELNETLEQEEQRFLNQQIKHIQQVFNTSLSYQAENLDIILQEVAKSERRNTLKPKVMAIDVNGLLKTLVSRAPFYGITNLTDACKEVEECPEDPLESSQYFFYDTLHPSAKVHSVFADYIYSLYQIHMQDN